MSLLKDISDWLTSKTQPDWVSDAGRRIFQQGQLTDTDIDDLAALLKSSKGIPDPKGRVAVRLDPSIVPAGQPDGAVITLTAIRQPVAINALAHSEGISFEHEGLTVVYGYNGVGKSGYGRALKAACRARDTERILHNVFNPPEAIVAPQAVFEWNADGAAQSVQWVHGQPAHPDLSSIAVFDARCARLFVDQENEIAVTPYGLDILRELVRGFDSIRAKLDEDIRANRFDQAKLAPLRGETEVGRLIANIGPKSDRAQFKRLATLTAAELDEQVRLHKQLNLDDPIKKAAEIRRQAQRIDALITEINQSATILSDPQIEALRQAMVLYVATEEASRIASSELSENGAALPGTGGEPWRHLIESAMTFAADVAYPGEQFPAPTDGSKCVLCQQPLDHDARERLSRFVKFLANDTQMKAKLRREEAFKLYKPVSEAKPELVPSNKTILDEIRDLQSKQGHANPEHEHGQVITSIADQVASYLAELAKRRDVVVAMAKGRKIDTLAGLSHGPQEQLLALSTRLIREAEEIEKQVEPTERKRCTERLEELNARIKLTDLLPLVYESIDKAILTTSLQGCLSMTDTTAVTRKSTELQKKAVAAGLNDALMSELNQLSLGNVQLKWELKGNKGSGKQQLKLTLPRPVERMSLSDVLSEGEQRAIALSCFLAETRLAHGASGIVFDDPVTSLDHVRKEVIARRLVREALDRQVIVFTHDLAFAWELLDAAKQVGAKAKTRHVYAAGSRKGMVNESLPFEGGKLDARINDVRSKAAQARKALDENGDYQSYELLVRRGYGMLRDCWERLIEEVLFGDAVRRFRKSVNTKNLKMASVDDEDFEAVWAGMTRCSNFTHDTPLESPIPLPDIVGFIADIDMLATALEKARERQKTTETRRVAKVPAAR